MEARHDDESHLIEVEVGDLGAFALAEEAAAAGIGREDLAIIACERLIGGLTSGRISAIPPVALVSTEPFLTPEEAAGQRLAIELSNAQWRTLQAEASLRGIEMDQLVGHAILAYLAAR